MLSSSLIVLLVASSFVSSLPALFQRNLPDVASVPGLGALQGSLGNVPGLDALANIPGVDAAATPPDNAAGNKTSDAAHKQKEKHQKGNKHANGNTEAGLVANSTTALGAVETGAANNTLVGGATDIVNGTGIATDALGNATATSNAGANTVTVTVTVTDTAGAANNTATDSAGATSSEVASSSSATTVADTQASNITSSTNTLPTSAPTQTPVYPGQPALVNSVDDGNDD